MTHPFTAAALVGIGGCLGSILRYSLSLVTQRFIIEWPLGTFTVNLLGCFFIGIITALVSRGETLSSGSRLFLATGFCGGFTTMSSMVYETAQMIENGEYFHASVYTAGTFIFSMAGFYAGVLAVRTAFKMGGGLWN